MLHIILLSCLSAQLLQPFLCQRPLQASPPASAQLPGAAAAPGNLQDSSGQPCAALGCCCSSPQLSRQGSGVAPPPFGFIFANDTTWCSQHSKSKVWLSTNIAATLLYVVGALLCTNPVQAQVLLAPYPQGQGAVPSLHHVQSHSATQRPTVPCSPLGRVPGSSPSSGHHRHCFNPQLPLDRNLVSVTKPKSLKCKIAPAAKGRRQKSLGNYFSYGFTWL